ncbi:ATP-binding protein [Octadecabacter sp. G9-8]|uniref:ATP-binding protein n=1 Tax=Octadecabacter dasysiphoniae TaxID=2909341 RepID=A0ABS9CRJ6_9RHOB|nr:ATP-binding protein [Octadecabacter dasysiphoniae]MCF2869858.1 ATP-binding protein [Octadecabacter dasysiphoniae]
MQNDLNDVDRTVVSLKAFVDEVLDQSGLFKFEVCASEALTNLVKHAKTDDTTAPIKIELTETPAAVILRVFDPVGAARFDLRDHAQSLDDVDPLAESGRGLGLIMQCADHADYAPQGDRMCLSLKFSKLETDQ